MAKDWIERRNIEFREQARRFTDFIVADPGAYGVDPADAALLAAEFADFDARYRATWSKLTRTTAGVILRDAARLALAKRMRAIAMIVRGNPAVTTPMRRALGMTVEPNYPPAPPKRPQSPPWLAAHFLPNGRLQVRMHDSGSSRRGVPRHCTGAQIFLTTGRQAGTPADLEQWRLLAVTSKARSEISLPQIKAGSPITVAARWYNTHGAGPSSNTVVVWVGHNLALPSARLVAA